MSSYGDFALVYDTFMDEIPYEKWCDNIISILEENGISEGIVLDLACGTGTLTRMLRDRGYDMIGVDASEEMLEVAREFEYLLEEEGTENKGHILYLEQDMREFELYGTVAAVVCCCDSINYLTDNKDVIHTLSLVNNYLDPGGLLIMDYNTPEKYAEIGEATIAENREDCSFIWENFYDEDTHINQYDLTLFIENEEGLYCKSEETHIQRGYSMEEMSGFVKEAGLELVSSTKGDDGRIVIVCREITKKL